MTIASHAAGLRVVVPPPIRLAGAPNAARPLFASPPRHEPAIPAAVLTSAPVRLRDVAVSATPKFSTGIATLDRVLGGPDEPGVTPASIILLTAEPGSGKSSLLMQVASLSSETFLYASAEETPNQIAGRARRIGACDDVDGGRGGNVHLLIERDLEQILRVADQVEARQIVLDSMQTTRLAHVSHGIDAQIRACAERVMQHCKARGMTAWIIGHVTKEGVAAGPETLAHYVDVTLHMRGDEDFPEYRVVQTIGKNRFGAVGEFGQFRMTGKGLVELDDGERSRIDEAIAARDEVEPGSTGIDYEPIARELARRYVEIGGVVDGDLRDRAAGLDLF